MDKNQEILEISKLVFELTLVGSAGVHLDELLARLLDVVANIPGLRVQRKGAILLYNPRKSLVQVAQQGLPSALEAGIGKGILDDIDPEFRQHAYSTSLGTEKALRSDEVDERFIVLPMSEDEHPIGLGILFLDPEWQPDSVELQFMTDLSRALAGLVMRSLMNETLRVRELELEEARSDAIRRLGAASEYRDNETGMHVMRMTHFAVAIAKAMKLPEQQRELLAITAPMHDVGKIGIADAILLKPGRLTTDEYEIMKSHTQIGSRILKGDDALIKAARDIALAHHEHWDGTGYPLGLAGESIPLPARICALADVFDALTSSRPYKAPWPLQQAIDWIRAESGRKFDPAVAAAFETALPEILRIRALYRDDIINPNEALELPELKPVDSPWIAWTDALAIGIEAIDAHHRYLLDLVNDLHEVIARKRGSREVGRILKSLEAYTHVHFQAEERMMEHYGFADLERQRSQHHGFEKKLQLFYAELHENPLTAPIDMLTYLGDWLIRHIMREDAQLRSLIATQ